MKIVDLFSKAVHFSLERKALLTIIAGRIGVALCSILTVKASTVLLKPGELGSLSELNSVVYLFFITLIVPVSHFITRGFLEWNDAGILKSISKKYIQYIIIVALFTSILMGILQLMFSFVKGFDVLSIILLVMAFLIFQPINGFGISGLNLFGLRKSYTFYTNLVAWASVFFSTIFFLIFPNKISWSVGQILGFGIGSLSVMSLWRRYKKSELITQTDRSNAILFSRNNILAFSWPFIFTSSLWWMQTQSYRFILGIYHGIENVGLFVTAYALAASPIMICEGIIAQYLEPTFYNNLKYQDREGQVRAWNNYARLFIPGMVVIGIYVAASVPFLAKLFLGGEYRTIAIKVSGWAAIIETTRSAGTMMFQLGMAKLDNRMTIWPAAVGAITAPSAVFFMTQFDSIYGTIGGLLFSGLLVLVTNILISYKVLPVTWPYKRILFSGLLSLPVFIALRLLFNLFPNPGYLESFFALAVSGIYVAVIVFYLLSSRFLNK